MGRDCWNAQECAEITDQIVAEGHRSTSGPTMLEALQAVSEWAEQANPAGYGGLPHKLRQQVDAAISKATEGQP